MMRNSARMASPPAAYAKYLDDFEECEEAQVSPSLNRAGDQRDTYGYSRGNDCKKIAQFGDFNAYGTMPTSSNSLQYSNTVSSSYPHYSGDPQRASQSSVDSHSDSFRFSKPKSIYEWNDRKKNVKTEKACFAFLKFGDCHYGDSCKFSHDPNLLNRSQKMADMHYAKEDNDKMELGLIYSDMESSDTTCRQLEKRLLEIQKELTMLEEESKKPKSSVVVPKRSQPLFPAIGDSSAKKSRSAFNVGGDFVVVVGNSRNEQTHSRVHHHDDRVHTSAIRRGNEHRQTPVTLDERRSNAVLKETHHPRKHISAAKGRHRESKNLWGGQNRNRSRNDNKKRGASSWNERTEEVSGEESISDEGTPLRFDAISSSDDEDGTKPSTSRSRRALKEKKNADMDAVSEESISKKEYDTDALLISDDDGDAIKADDVSDEEESVEPLELSSVVNPDELIEISDDELPKESDASRHDREPSSLRTECLLPSVLSACPIIYEKLPDSVIEQLSENGLLETEKAQKRPNDFGRGGQLLTGFRQEELIAKYTNAKKEEEDESFCEELFDLMDEAEAIFLDES